MEREDADGSAKEAWSSAEDETGEPCRKSRRRSSAGFSTKEPSQDSKSAICYLPPEMMSRIFSHLSPREQVLAAQVCKQWRDVIYIPHLWKGTVARVHLGNIGTNVIRSLEVRQIQHLVVLSYKEKKYFDQAMSTLTALKSVDLRQCKRLSGENLKEAFTEDLPNLEELKLPKIAMLGEAFDTVSKHMENLVRLSLDMVSDNGTIEAINKNLFHLQDLDLHYLKIVNRHKTWTLPKVATLRRLHLRRYHLKKDKIKCLARDLPNLQKLCLMDTGVENLHMKPISEMQFLQHLILSGSYITDEGLEHLGKKCLSLRIFAFDSHWTVTDEGWVHIARMTNLQELNLMNAKIRDTDLQVLSTGLQNLTILNIRGCRRISDVGLQSISQMSKLEALNLPLCRVGDKGMEHLSQGALLLLHLDISSTHVTGAGLRFLCAGQRSLKTLDISFTSGADAALHAINHLPFLQVLQVSYRNSHYWERLKRANPLLTVRFLSFEYHKNPHVQQSMRENAFSPPGK